MTKSRSDFVPTWISVQFFRGLALGKMNRLQCLFESCSALRVPSGIRVATNDDPLFLMRILSSRHGNSKSVAMARATTIEMFACLFLSTLLG